MKTMEGVHAWNRSCNLAVQIQQSINACDDPSFHDQLTRTSLAVATRIASGYELDSPEQFSQHLKNAMGACAELRTQLYIAGELGLIDIMHSNGLIAQSLELSTLLQGMVAWCQDKMESDGSG